MLDGKTVLVSGVGPGLGRQIAEVALEQGARVVLGGRDGARLKGIADELDAGQERVAWRATDITSVDDCAAIAQLAVERFGAIDALVNCAARYATTAGFADSDLGEWNDILTTNVMGTVQMTRAALPALSEHGGAIVFIGTQSAFWPYLPQASYDASKGALVSLNIDLAKELGPRGIRVNMVLPTWMWGPAVQGYVESAAAERGVAPGTVYGEIVRDMPLGKMPTDRDVAQAVVFFTSDWASMITGQALFVNAGEYFRH